MSKPSSAISPYVQQAIREKAERDLAALDVRLSAFDAVDRALDSLVELSGALGQSTPAIAQTAPDASVVAKLKKLRRALLRRGDRDRARGADRSGTRVGRAPRHRRRAHGGGHR